MDNSVTAAYIGIKHIEMLKAADEIARNILWVVNNAERAAIKKVAKHEDIVASLSIVYNDIAALVSRKAQTKLKWYSDQICKIMADAIFNLDLEESSRQRLAKMNILGVSGADILRMIHTQNVSGRIAAQMAKARMTPERVAQDAIVRGEEAIRRSVVSQYFAKMRSIAYKIGRTSVSQMAGNVSKKVYESLPRSLVGFQVHGILDDKIRPAHRERNGTIYYKTPRYGNKGFDQMPNPPMEADGTHAWNCRCVTGKSRIHGYAKSISRCLYNGEFFKIRTAGGAEITVTANHPVATQRGLILANEVLESDYLITDSCGISDFSRNINNEIPTIEDVFKSLSEIGIVRLNSPSTLEFHGDGKSMNGKIDIIFADRMLMDDGDANLAQGCDYNRLVGSRPCHVGGPDLPSSLLFRHPAPLKGFRSTLASWLDTSVNKPFDKAEGRSSLGTAPVDSSTRNSVLLTEGVNGFTRLVSFDKIMGNFFSLGDPSRFRFSPELDPVAGHAPLNGLAFNSEFSSKLIKRHAGSVSFDKIAHINRFHDNAFVYSIDSYNGYYMGSDNNIAIAQGNCWLSPVIASSPDKFYDFKGRIIPNPRVFNEWFSNAPKSTQVLATGVKRYQEAEKRLKRGEKLAWWHLMDPSSGALLDPSELKAESAQSRSNRIKKAKNLIFKT